MIPFHATRLAPSPTGALHLGHARTFLVTWWLARRAGAKIFMRMEDLDLGRAKPESVAQAYADLRWLGMDWDACEPGEGEFGVRAGDVAEGTVVQSRRVDVYEGALQRLWERGAVYPCTCTRAEIAASVQNAGNAPHESEGNVRYPGTCDRAELVEPLRGMSVQEATRAVRERTGKAVCWRLRVEAGVVKFEDVIAGRQAFDVAGEVGDFPVTRFVGVGGEGGIPAAYQLACVVDDHAMGIDLVVRGDDLLSSSPRQMLVYRALGWAMPRFAHVPLVVGADGKRLAKRHGESRIAQFRAAGVKAERVAGWAAWRSGQLETLREAAARSVTAGVALERLPRERVVLGEEDLGWLR
jgi:glutamyl-tRNA synthetase